MNEKEKIPGIYAANLSFFDQPQVEKIIIPVAAGVPLGIHTISNPALGIGGAYGSWGESYDNQRLPELISQRLGAPLASTDQMDLASLGFTHRHHISYLTATEHLEVETVVGAHLLRRAAQACGWEMQDVDAVIIGMSGPVANDYVDRIARAAGITDDALKISIHKACDGSAGGLHLALNPGLEVNARLGRNLAEELRGKKVLVGGIEGLSRFVEHSQDINALQLFGNGAGVIGVIPGETIKFLVGKSHEVFDEEGVLGVTMYYPHSKHKFSDQSNIEISQEDEHHVRVAGLMNEPADGRPVSMAGPMGMVKLFVRTGVQVVQEVYQNYQEMLEQMGRHGQNIAVAIVHHANLKINKLKEKHLSREGVNFPMPWLLSEFGNVSAASNMIAFLRQLPQMKHGDHVLIDGFGAGTYYDVMVVELP